MIANKMNSLNAEFRAETEERGKEETREVGKRIIEVINEAGVFENVDMDGVLGVVQEKIDRVTSGEMRRITDVYFKDMGKGDIESLKYMGEVLELNSLPKLGYFDGADKLKMDAFHRKGEIWLSSDLVRPRERVELIAHECFHEYQKQGGQDELRVRMYEINHENYLKVRENEKGYYNQLVERGAYIFGLAVANFYNYVSRTNWQFSPGEEVSLHKRAVKEALRKYSEFID